MTLLAAVPASTGFTVQLLIPAVRALALSAVAGIGLAAFRVKNTPMRLFTWTAVLYAALGMPLLGRMLPPLAVPTPAFVQNALRQREAAPPASQEVETAVSLATPGSFTRGEVLIASGQAEQGTALAESARSALPSSVVPRQGASKKASRPAGLGSFLSSLSWSTVAGGTYLAGALLLLLRFLVGLEFGRRLLRAAQTVDEPRIVGRLAARAHASGLGLIPQARESEFISVPVTMGVLRSTILLPCGWRDWDDAKLDAVIAHEVSHVARRDALTQRISLLHRAIFWFSPLAWWLDRHLADLAEQASDEAALSCGTDRKNYATILLEFFEALQAAPGRVWWQGVAMAKAGQAEQRVERILSWKGSVAMRLKKSIAVVVITLAVPVVFLVASVHTASYAGEPQHLHFAQQQTPTPTPKAEASETPAPPAAEGSGATPLAAPQAEPNPAPPMAGTIDGTIPVPPPARAPVAYVPPVHPGRYGITVYPAKVVIAPLPPVAAVWSGQSNGSGSGGIAYHYGYDDEQRFVIVSGKSDSFTMSGSGEDARHVEKLKKSIQGDFIWFQRDEKSYIIRDQATIDRAKKFWAEEEELGKKQAELGAQQEALGKQQEELGEKMEQVHVSVPDMTAQLDKLKAELKALSSGATVEQVGHIQSEIGELQASLGEVEARAGGKQGELGRLQGELGEKQGKLGERQGELGRKQGELAEKASLQMKGLLDEAIAKGLAQPEP